VGGMAFTPDGTKLVTSSSDDQAIHVWDLRAIREQLDQLRLDWDAAPYPKAEPAARLPLRVTVDLGFVNARSSVRLQSMRLALHPFDYEAYLLRGQAYTRLRQPEKAVADFRAKAMADFSMVLALAPDNHVNRAEALLYRSWVYRDQNDVANFRADLQQIADQDLPLPLELTVIAAQACNDLAWHYVTCAENERRPQEALSLIRKAIKLTGEDWMLFNTEGVVHYRLGEHRQAIEWFDRSLREGGGEAPPFDLFFLAMCHAELGKAARAKDCYEQAVRWVRENQPVINANPGWSGELQNFRAEAEAVLARNAPN